MSVYCAPGVMNFMCKVSLIPCDPSLCDLGNSNVPILWQLNSRTINTLSLLESFGERNEVLDTNETRRKPGLKKSDNRKPECVATRQIRALWYNVGLYKTRLSQNIWQCRQRQVSTERFLPSWRQASLSLPSLVVKCR